MKTNLGKFQFMVFGVKNMAPFRLDVNGKTISCSNEVKLLGITINNELIFKKHIEDLCKKTSYKLHVLRRIRGYLTAEKARILANAVIDCQFNYAPLIWIFAGKTLVNKIWKIRHRTLRWVTMNTINHTKNFFNSTITCLINQRHLQYQSLEIFESLKHLNPGFLWYYFNEDPFPYDLRKGTIPLVKSFCLALILYISEEVSYGITLLHQSRLVKL